MYRLCVWSAGCNFSSMSSSFRVDTQVMGNLGLFRPQDAQCSQVVFAIKLLVRHSAMQVMIVKQPVLHLLSSTVEVFLCQLICPM